MAREGIAGVYAGIATEIGTAVVTLVSEVNVTRAVLNSSAV